ncbi:MAG: 4a-hydroxytetrahydrobiopterin dehydratase [Bacteroidetes bacterium]|nr:4a-hydroxytetrahydrobiopterin dehydratase [Bacteroidota bacterium]
MKRKPLDQDSIDKALRSLSGWECKDDRLAKTFVLGDFREAVAFIVRIGFCAESLNHHPELYNVYNRVRVELTTHDAGNKITTMDVVLAQNIDKMISK